MIRADKKHAKSDVGLDIAPMCGLERGMGGFFFSVASITTVRDYLYLLGSGSFLSYFKTKPQFIKGN